MLANTYEAVPGKFVGTRPSLVLNQELHKLLVQTIVLILLRIQEL